jgi:S-adenosylmethionine-diacylglycerol 3-amino-3-carboxypropyl transferase
MVKTDNFILRYSNCWEDADLLTAQLTAINGGKICSVASGGENSLSLLTTDPELLVIVDVNPLQIYLSELKLSACKNLEYEDCLSFLGYQNNEKRWEIFLKLKNDLSDQSRNYWLTQRHKIEQGIIHAGYSENNFRFFAKYIRPLIHNDHTVKKLLSVKSKKEQQKFYSEVWNNIRWRWIFKLFFSRFVMKKMAPDPDFLLYFKGNIGDYLYEKTSKELSSVECQTNHILNYMLKGDFGDILPHFIRPENFSIIKERAGAVRFYKGFAEEPASEYGPFNAYNLSNIFEYTTSAEFKNIVEKLNKGGKKDCLYIYWNILIPKKMAEMVDSGLINLLDTSVSPMYDKGWLYSACLLDKKL